MKKKRLIPLIVLCAALALVIALYAALSAYNDENAAAADSTDGKESPVSVISVSEADITTIAYKSEKLDISLEKKNDRWIFPDDAAFPVDNAKVSKMISAVSSLTAQRTLDGTDAESYGLDEPKLTVTFKLAESEYQLTLGDTNSYNSLSYLGFDGKVYMISDTLSSVFDVSKDDLFAVDDAFPSELTADSVSAVEITVNGETVTVSDSDGIGELVHALQKYCSFAKPEGYGLDEDGLAEYGIGEASPRVSVSYTVASAKAVFDILFGESSDGKPCYTLPGSITTYSMDSEGYREIMNYIYYSPSTGTVDSDPTETADIAEE